MGGFDDMDKAKYDDEFKLQVVKEWLESSGGVRLVARSYGLPSKNYIHRWLEELKEKGLIPPEAGKTSYKSSANPRTQKAQDVEQTSKKSAREKHLEKEILRLRAENDFLKKLDELERRGFPNK